MRCTGVVSTSCGADSGLQGPPALCTWYDGHGTTYLGGQAETLQDTSPVAGRVLGLQKDVLT